MSLSQDFKYKFSHLNILEKIIAINVVVFLVSRFVFILFKGESNPIFKWFEFPVNLGDFIVQPWSLITYAFIHYDFWHLAFNMLWLYFIGRLFLNLFNTKMALNIYFLGAIFGALLFMLGYNILPSFFNKGTLLVGASAAVRALLIFLCAYMPKMDVRIFTFNLKLWYLGAAIVILDLLGLFGNNPGGNTAHLGGALLGYFYAIQLQKGTDIGKGFERFMDSFVNLFKGASKKTKLKTVHKKNKGFAGHTKGEFSEYNKQKQIDIILDKISKSGYDSLTKEEKEFLFKAGE
ncbi:MAG: rhomboid family intramembrane serine protease [Bacteroidia bacterium]|nr:rhomboid family intramembrane serine protease [Bacteroidia bacterium]